MEQARFRAAPTADLATRVTCFEVGRLIVEEEQGGYARALAGSFFFSALLPS
ncbi:MAG: hypothetical protein LBJ64_10970 [Deltaproteobacteria bacterium]|jgi:hypothetical protein|nr:hypothetical protein [Deltaproteobacteria bacterium]